MAFDRNRKTAPSLFSEPFCPFGVDYGYGGPIRRSMDKSLKLKGLKLALAHVAKGEQTLSRQRKVVAELKRGDITRQSRANCLCRSKVFKR
jgi:hypothetical protein